MAELSTEQNAENILMGAFAAEMGGGDEGEKRDPNQLEGGQDLDQRDEQEEVVEGEEKPETKAKAEAETEVEEDTVEIPGEEGQEPTRIALKEVLAGYQEYKQIETQRAEIIERTQREATEQATQSYRQVEQYAQRVAVNLQAALQLLQPPQPPNADEMLNPSSPKYDPDAYHRLYAGYQRTAMQYNQAQGVAQQLLQQAQHASEQASEQRETQELQRLERAWPGFSQPEALNKFVSDMGKAYGYSPQELDASLNDHRNALVARDALAYRAMKAQSGDVKAKVEAKAPKLVRSKQEARGSTTQQRDAGGKFVGGAYADFKKTGSDDAAARMFAGLLKAGRI